MLNRTKRWLIGLIVAGGLLGLTTAVFAQGHGWRDCPKPATHSPLLSQSYLQEVLELTEEQAAAIEQIREAGHQAHLELRQKFLQLQNEMNGEMLKTEPAEARLTELVKAMGDMRTQLQLNRLHQQLALLKELTPEQRNKWVVLREQGRRPGRHGSWGGQRDHWQSGDCRRGRESTRGWRRPGRDFSW
jgi:Spy/CpxP family protein refolding chaperone